MSIIVIIIIVLLLFGGGGMFYGYNRGGWTGYGPGLGIVGVILVIVLLYWLLSGRNAL